MYVPTNIQCSSDKHVHFLICIPNRPLSCMFKSEIDFLIYVQNVEHFILFSKSVFIV